MFKSLLRASYDRHCTGTLEISLLCYSLKDKFLDKPRMTLSNI
jgi:hypothetical protein